MATSATVHPVDDYIFVRRHETNVTDGGIHIPEMRESDENAPLKGAIAALGPGVPLADGQRARLAVVVDNKIEPVFVGDGVIYTADVARTITIDTGKFDVLRFRDAICVLKQKQTR